VPYLLYNDILIYFPIGKHKLGVKYETADDNLEQFITFTPSQTWIRAQLGRTGDVNLELTHNGLTYNQLKSILPSISQVYCNVTHFSIVESYPADSLEELAEGYGILINEILIYLKLE
jgi:hypothetical protein